MRGIIAGCTLAAVLFSAAAVIAEGPIPLLTGPQEIGGLTATLNTLIRQVNVLAPSITGSMTATGSNAVLPTARTNLLPGSVTALYYAKDYGSCTWDATHDVAACINLAADDADAAGGGCIILPAGAFGQSVAITRTKTLCLIGAGSTHIVGANGTELKWIGTGAARMLSVASPSGSTSNKKIADVRIEGITFNGNAGLAKDGVYLQSILRGKLSDLAFVGGFTGGNTLSLDIVSAVSGVTFGESTSLQNVEVDNLWIDNTGFNSNGVYLGGYLTAARLGGNASENIFRNGIILGNAGCGIYSYGSDNNRFEDIRVFNSVCSVDLQPSHDVGNTVLYSSNGMIFNHYAGTGPFTARGTSSSACVAYTTPLPANDVCSYANYVDTDATNSTPAPVIEAGAQLAWDTNRNLKSGIVLMGQATIRPGVVVTEAASTAGGCDAAALVNGVNTSTYICNTNDASLLQFDDLGSERFALRFNTGDLEFKRLAGAKKYIFSDAPVSFGAGIQNNGNLLVSQTPPTIASGGCTTGSAQSISQSNGSAAFEITLGGATCGSTITLTMAAAPHNWVCDAHNITTPASNVLDMTGAASTTAVVLTNYVRTTGVAGNFTGADKLAVKCSPY